MALAQNLIEVEGLWKVFGDRPERVFEADHSGMSRTDIQSRLNLVVALRDVSFSVAPGETFVVMGLSGSGKSTLVRCLVRLIEASRGQIRFAGENILGYSPREMMEFRRGKVAMVFQSYGLLPHRRVIDNVTYGLEIRGVEKRARYRVAAEVIETVGLKGWENYLPGEMSGGMQQRVGIARALAVNPDVLLLDEPFSGLDPLIRREMQDELVALQAEMQKTVVFITHDLNEALKIGDRIAIMRDGEIVQEGSPEEIVTLPADEYVSEFVQDVPRAKVIQVGSVMQDPKSVVGDWQGPRVALHLMQNHGIEKILVVGRDRRLKGLLTKELAKTLAARETGKLADGRIAPVVKTRPESYIEEIIPMAALNEGPIAVVDDQERLLGELHPGTLLAGMAENQLTGQA